MEENTALIKSAAERLSDTSEEIRFAAVKDISRTDSLGAVPLLMQMVGDSSYRIREEALQGICSFPPERIFPKLEAFLRNHDDANLRNAAIEAFPRYGEEATPYLLKLLKDFDEEVRIFSAVMLGDVADSRSVEALINAIGDSDDNVKHAAVECLGKIKDARAVGPLIECLMGEFWIQYPAVVALGDIEDPEAIKPLISLLNDEMLREAVIEALGKIGDISIIPVLAKILSQNDTSIRNNTIAALVNIQSRIEKHVVPDGTILPSIKKTLDNDDLIDHLLNSLKDSDPEIKKNAVIALGWLKEKRATTNLVELLNDYELEEYVVGSLVSIGEGALPELISGLENPDPRIRVSLIRCIEWVGDESGIEECIPFLMNNEDNEVRLQAIAAMSGALKTERVEDALLVAISDPDDEIKLAVIETLGKSQSSTLIQKLLSTLSSEQKSRKLAAIRLLGRIEASEAFEPLEELLKEKSDEIRAEIYKSLSAIRPDGISSEIFINGLKDESPIVRKASADCLATSSKEDAVSSLIPLLKDSDPEVRIASLETLGKIGGASCAEHLIEAFSTGDKRFRLAIVRVIGNIHDRAGTQFLVDLLKKADSDLKRHALESLGRIGDKKTVPNIIVTLDDADWSVRSAAIESLEMIGDRKCASHLLKKLQDSEDIIKKRTIVALGKLGAEEAVNSILPLMHDENLLLEVIDALEKLGIPDLDFYYKFFERSNSRLKSLLVDVLGRLKDSRALDYLVKIIEDEFFTVRCRAAKALGEMGDRKAIPHLLKAQKADPSEDVQREAVLALKRLDAVK